jgi:hypothetical protein
MRIAGEVTRRAYPFAEVWPEIEALLRQDAGLQAKTVSSKYFNKHSRGRLTRLCERAKWDPKGEDTKRNVAQSKDRE